MELTKYETEEEDKEINIKKFFQFLEGHVLSKKDPDIKDGLPKYSRRNGRGRLSEKSFVLFIPYLPDEGLFPLDCCQF